MILLLHGALGAAASMQPLQEKIRAQGADVHALDFSGHGDAPWPERGFSMDVFEDDVLRFLDENGVAAAHIFGYSMGGFVGLRLAWRAPERVLSLSTLATKMDWTEASCAAESSMLQPDVIAGKVPRFAEALSAAHPRNGWRKVVDETRRMIAGMHLHRISEEALAFIRQPIRVMLGDRDKTVCIEEAVALYRALPHASLCILPDTPHPLERMDMSLLAVLISAAIKQ